MTADSPPRAHRDAAAARQKNDFAVHGFANISAFYGALQKNLSAVIVRRYKERK